MADYSNGAQVGQRVKVETIAWGENQHFIGREGVVVRVDRNDVHQPIKVKLDSTGTEEWVKTVSLISTLPLSELGQFKKKLYDEVMRKKEDKDWCDDADAFLREVGAMPTEVTPEPPQGSVIGLDTVSGHYVYRRMTGYRDGERSWSRTGDEEDYTWTEVLADNGGSTIRVLFQPEPGTALPKAVVKQQSWV